SSRRRHTRFSRDWSSDVCSSDLHRQRVVRTQPLQKLQVGYGSGRTETGAVARGEAPTKPSQQLAVGITGLLHHPPGAEQTVNQEIGRASCRERERRQGGPEQVKE